MVGRKVPRVTLSRSTSQISNRHGNSRQHISGATDIALNVAALTIPMLVFCIVLLFLVFHHRVEHESLPSDDPLTIQHTGGESGYYYVKISSTYLIFVASWSSTLAPILAVCITTLWSFPVAADLLQASEEQYRFRLPTPYQLALTLRMLEGGGWASLWQWLKYLWCWRGSRRSHGRALQSVGTVLIFAQLLGVLVFLADTWLHISTKTVPFVRTTPISDVDLPEYGNQLSENCTHGLQNDLGTSTTASARARDIPTVQNGGIPSCAIIRSDTMNYFTHPLRVIEVLNNISSTMAVATYYDEVPYVYIGVSPSYADPNTDFSAATFGLQTQCEPITKECDMLSEVGAATPFKCNDVFYGDVATGRMGNVSSNPSAGQFQLWPFTNRSMSALADYLSTGNPYYTGFAVHTLGATNSPEMHDTGSEKGEVIVPMHGGLAFVLACRTSVYDISYDWTGGHVSRFDVRPSNDTVAAMAQGILGMTSSAGWSLSPQMAYLTTATITATASATAQEMADKIALAFSKASLALFTTSIVPRQAQRAYKRESFLVAKVPMAALFTLIVTNLLFIVTGIALLVASLMVRREGVDDVQARLTITGLVADRFEDERRSRAVGGMEGLFDEHEGGQDIRVTLERTIEDGYVYDKL